MKRPASPPNPGDRPSDRAMQCLKAGEAEQAVLLWQEAQCAGDDPEGLVQLRKLILDSLGKRFKAAIHQGDHQAAEREAQMASGLGSHLPGVRRMTEAIGAWRRAIELAQAAAYDGARGALDELAAPYSRAPWIRRAKRVLRDGAKVARLISDSPLAARQRDPDDAQPASPATTDASVPQDVPGRFMLWVDGIGSYLVLTRPAVVVGRTTAKNSADLPLRAAASRRHAQIERVEGDWFLTAHKATLVNGRPVESALLCDGDEVQFGRAPACRFGTPSRLSATSVMTFSGACLPSRDTRAVVLMADNVIMGTDASCHVQSGSAETRAVLFRGEDGLKCQTEGRATVNGQERETPCAVQLGDRVEADGWIFSLTGDLG